VHTIEPERPCHALRLIAIWWATSGKPVGDFSSSVPKQTVRKLGFRISLDGLDLPSNPLKEWLALESSDWGIHIHISR
jgi:hypothetical protein